MTNGCCCGIEEGASVALFEHDYEEDILVRQIRNIIRGVLKLVFHMDTPSQFQREMALDALANRLMKEAAAGNINEAENLLYEQAESHDPETLRAGVAFYEYLNSLDDAVLEQHDYTREEIYEGLWHLLKTYQLGGMAGLYEEEPEPEVSETPGYPSAEELNPAYYNYSVCPYCGKEMERGYLKGEAFRPGWKKGHLYWCDNTEEFDPPRLSEEQYTHFGSPCIRAYRCETCRRIILHSEPEEGI